MENYNSYTGENAPEHPNYKEEVKPVREFDLRFRGVDDWSRPVFKVVDKAIYFGSTEILVPDKELGLVDKESIIKYFKDNTNKLEYFGTSFDCEPNGGTSTNWKFNILD